MIKGIQKTTLVDYPGNVATIVFVGGCNFRCGYCYNKDLVQGDMKDIDLKEVFSFLNKRKNLIDGVVVSGGEPCLWPGLGEFCRKVKQLGLLVKLDTNGSKPLVLKSLVDAKLVDYIAMDVKAPFERYDQICGCKVDIEAVRKSIHFLVGSSIEHEFRCTIHSKMLNYNEMVNVAELVKGGKRLYFQLFRDWDVLDASLNKKSKFSKVELDKVVLECNKMINTSVRV